MFRESRAAETVSPANGFHAVAALSFQGVSFAQNPTFLSEIDFPIRGGGHRARKVRCTGARRRDPGCDSRD